MWVGKTNAKKPFEVNGQQVNALAKPARRKQTECIMCKFKKGDVVRTKKGDQFNKDSRNWNLIVIETGKYWSTFPAIVCKKPDGKKGLFLEKNLYHKK